MSVYKDYLELSELVIELKRAATKDSVILSYQKLLVKLMKLSNKKVEIEKETNWQKLFLFINELFVVCYLKSSLQALQDFVILSFINLCTKIMENPIIKKNIVGLLNNKVIDIDPMLELLFRLIIKSIINGTRIGQEFLRFIENDLHKKDPYEKVHTCNLLEFFLNDNLVNEKELKTSNKEREVMISKLIQLGANLRSRSEDFLEAIGEIIRMYTISLFKVRNKEKVYHATTLSNFRNIFKSNETWLRKTKNLNDKNEQTEFFSVLKEADHHSFEMTNEKSKNDDYVSLSFTRRFPSNFLIEKYSKGKENAVVIEFEKFNLNSLLWRVDLFKIYNKKWVQFSKAKVGMVIYDEKQIMHMWRKCSEFINSINCEEIHKYKFLRISLNIFKMFYKRKKWEGENEVRLIILNPISENSLRLTKEDENFWKFQGQTWSSFSKIYVLLKDNKDKVIKIVEGDKISNRIKEELNLGSYNIETKVKVLI